MSINQKAISVDRRHDITPWRPQDVPDVIDVDYVSEPDNTEFHLRDYLRILLKRRYLILLVFFAVVGLIAYKTVSTTPLYTATATLQIEPQDPEVVQIQELLASADSGGGPYDYY